MDVSNVAVLDMVKSREALSKVIKMKYGESGVDYEHLFFFGYAVIRERYRILFRIIALVVVASSRV